MPNAAGSMSTKVRVEQATVIRERDRLVPVDAQPYDLQFFPHPPRAELPLGKAQIMALAEAGTQAGFDLAGYCTQAQFLIGNGLPERLAEAEARAHDPVIASDEPEWLALPAPLAA